jgi:four helix bundle protein
MGLAGEAVRQKMVSRPEELRSRTKQFAIRVVRLFKALPRSEEARILGRQVLRSGTSVAANYRAACRARSRAEFVAKVGVVLEEADETEFWLELLIETGIIEAVKLQNLLAETRELVRIFSSSQITAKSRQKARSRPQGITQSPDRPITQ